MPALAETLPGYIRTAAVARGSVNTPTPIDGLITAHLRGWTLDRLPAVDARLGSQGCSRGGLCARPVVVDEGRPAGQSCRPTLARLCVNGVLGQVMLWPTPRSACGRSKAMRGGRDDRLELRVVLQPSWLRRWCSVPWCAPPTG